MNYVIKRQEMEPRKYPYYAENAEQEFVVYFTDTCTGIVILCNESAVWKTGKKRTDWNEDSFTPLPKGTVLEVTL